MDECWNNIGPHVDVISPVLAYNRCCRGITHFHMLIDAGGFEVAQISRSKTVGICGIKSSIMHTVLVTWQYTTWK